MNALRRLIVSVLAISLAALPRSVMSATDAPLSWQGVTLGAPASTLRPVWGDPLRIVVLSDGAQVARYWLPGSDNTYLLVVERKGYIRSFEIFAEPAPTDTVQSIPVDPSGVRLGDTLQSVASKHSDFHQSVDPEGRPLLVGRISATTGAAYSFENGRVRNINWVIKLADYLSELPPVALPAGDSVSTAILDVQKDEIAGAAWEYRFLAFHPCGAKVRWQLKSQALIQADGRPYDVLHVVCPETKSERDFVFDISSYFGKF
jgi:hypothetical protein